jgi:hypothetical protein
MNFISSIFPYSTTVGFNSLFKIIEIKIIKLHFLQSLQPFPDRNQFPILIYFALSVPLTVWRKKTNLNQKSFSFLLLQVILCEESFQSQVISVRRRIKNQKSFWLKKNCHSHKSCSCEPEAFQSETIFIWKESKI